MGSCPLVALIAELLYNIKVLVLKAARMHEKISHAAQRGLFFLRAEGDRASHFFGRVDLKFEHRARCEPEPITDRRRNDNATVVVHRDLHDVECWGKRGTFC